jgi:hypothetical protein
VGTDEPDCPLHVLKGGTEIAVSVFDVAVFQNSGDNTNSAYVRILAGDHGKAVLQFGKESNAALESIACDIENDEMEITAGKVGIGTTSPNEKLEVAGKIRANTAFNVNGTDGISQVVSILDRNGLHHNLTFTGGILTSYTTS